MKVELIEYPTEHDWKEVLRRALITVGKSPLNPPSRTWRYDILQARHSPIRRLWFSFLITDCPSWVATHLARHVHAQPYIRSQRNDRQSDYDRNKAPQDAPVSMIYDVNAEELMTIANKRLCGCAARETQECVYMMCEEVIKVMPVMQDRLVPMCVENYACKEMKSCGRKALWFEWALLKNRNKEKQNEEQEN